jgi:hypothetical protein
MSNDREIYFIQLIFNTQFVFTNINKTLENFKFNGINKSQYQNFNNFHQNDIINNIKIISPGRFIDKRLLYNTLGEYLNSIPENNNFCFFKFNNLNFYIKTPILINLFKTKINKINNITNDKLILKFNKNNNFCSFLIKIYNYIKNYCIRNNIYDNNSTIKNILIDNDEITFNIKINNYTKIINNTSDLNFNIYQNILNYRVSFSLNITGFYYVHRSRGYYIQLIAKSATFYSP